ncbi:hypothetical protein HG535_0A01600 [Zygotorulaspora mrakii]|uniref:Rho-GAP domain-containing protein n=1 Tax=Zygotorulaspora mrakii TaxID=42260 RepID=A0A7H9AXB1_ZYGMR|nr:uncharacterized protein HG535_0A01600 [Zygotorulaspora mrakii]QLG70222.1 hypothetical protein HG535_0A01600 [Zygotorulaspora mrakii]
MLYVNVSSIFFKSYSVDPISGHIIYVFDSTYLPSPEEVGDKQVYDLLIDELMDKLIGKLPRGPFSLVVFSSGFSKKKISWIYGIKMFAKLPKELRGFLQKTYIVHESFFIRTVYQVLSNAMNIKLLSINPLQDPQASSENAEPHLFSHNQSMVHVENLTELATLIDITTLRISLNVYLHDYQFNDYITLPEAYFTRLSSGGVRQYRQLIFDKIFKRLVHEAPSHQLVFQKPGSYKKVNILLDIIERNNYIDLSQWDIYSLATVFLHFLKTKTHPLIPIDLIPLPISDDYDYTYMTFCNIIKSNHYFDLFETIFPLFKSLLQAANVTNHTMRTLSKALTPTICQEKVSMTTSDRLAVGTRFIGNLLEHFNDIMERIERARTGRTQIVSPLRNKTTGKLPPRQPLSSQPVSSVLPSTTMIPPPVPCARKSSPTKYGNLETVRPSRPTSPFACQQKTRRSTSSTSTLSVENTNSTSLKPGEDIYSSSRVNSDSTATVSETPNSSSSRISSSSSSSSSSLVSPVIASATSGTANIPESISQMVTEESDTPALDISRDLTQQSTQHDINITELKIDDKFLQFDKDLTKKKKLNSNVGKDIKFSAEGYSDIKVGNKVSKLAALYEERLQGFQVMNEIQRSSRLS